MDVAAEAGKHDHRDTERAYRPRVVPRRGPPGMAGGGGRYSNKLAAEARFT